LLDFIQPKAQIFITSLHPSLINDAGRQFEIREGRVYGKD